MRLQGSLEVKLNPSCKRPEDEETCSSQTVCVAGMLHVIQLRLKGQFPGPAQTMCVGKGGMGNESTNTRKYHYGICDTCTSCFSPYVFNEHA